MNDNLINIEKLKLGEIFDREVEHEKFMGEAIIEAYEGINNGDGGPFGAIIIKNNKIVGRGHNCVIKKHDPTCHGEIEAIRNACKNLGTYDLTDCILYTTAEPCPMCLGAILWANIDKIYYGCNCKDTENIGFRDSIFYECLNGNSKRFTKEELNREECLKLFNVYNDISNKENY